MLLQALAVLCLGLSLQAPVVQAQRPDRVQNLPQNRPAFTAPQRAIVLIGGWSNSPEDFLGGDSILVQGLARKLFIANENWPGGSFRNMDFGGSRYLLLTRHKDPWGDILQNAQFEAGQIVQFLDTIRRTDPTVDTSFDLIGFSMGGLISRTMVLDASASLGIYHVKNLVCIGTPNHGVSPVIVGAGTLMNAATGRSPVGVNEMAVQSPYLRNLNSRAIPAAIRVSTIAGSAFVDSTTTPHDHDTGTVPCTHRNEKCPHEVVIRGVVQRHPNGNPVRPHIDGTCFRELTDQVNIPCAHLPLVRRHVEIGADGLVRILSVQLNNREAANLGPQHVVKEMWHTTGTMDLARSKVAGQQAGIGGTPAPRPFINALGCTAENLPGNPPPILGVGAVAGWFFSKTEVLDKLKQITQ